MAYRFRAFGVGCDYPEGWRVQIVPTKTFSDENGVVRFDDMRPGNVGNVTVTLSWETASVQDDFVQKYLDNVERQYQKKMKKRCRVLSKEHIVCNGHPAGKVHALMQASTHVLRPFGKPISLEILQIVYHCDQSGQIIMGTVTAEQGYFEKNRDVLQEMLNSIRCHEVIDSPLLVQAGGVEQSGSEEAEEQENAV